MLRYSDWKGRDTKSPRIELIIADKDEFINKNLLPSEEVPIAEQLRPQIEKEARKAQLSGLKQYRGVKFTPRESVGEKTRDIIASQLNTSWRTLEKAKEIVDSGDKELVAKMDRSNTGENQGQENDSERTLGPDLYLTIRKFSL